MRDRDLYALLTLESVSMWPAYISAVSNHIEDPEKKICFDRFHVAQHFSKGVNKVRAEETAELRAEGDTTLVGSRFLWLQNPENMKPKARFELLREATLKVARA